MKDEDKIGALCITVKYGAWFQIGDAKIKLSKSPNSAGIRVVIVAPTRIRVDRVGVSAPGSLMGPREK